MGAAQPPAVDLSRWPLVGRDDELALARSALTEHGSVVLTGAAGVGKTRLARELLAAAAAEGHRTEWVVATQTAATVPLGAVAHLVPGAAVGRGRTATLRAIVSALEPAAGEQPRIIGVDDAHLLDDASAALVHLLATSGAASVVVTLRSGEPAPDSILALWKDGPAPLVTLQALARPEVDEVVTTGLGGMVEGATLHRLWESSRGNSLFLRELVQGGIESDALRYERGLWRWHGPLEPGERLHDLVRMRMGRLDDDERATLELIAVGEPLPLACVRNLGIAEVIERLERRGLVAPENGDRPELRLAHPLFGEVLRPGIPATRLDDIRRHLADVVEASGELQPRNIVRIGLWRAAVGDREHPEQLRTAARRARVLGDERATERLARAALDCGPDLEAGYLLGEALGGQGRTAEALEVWSTVENLPGSDWVRASLAIARAGLLAYQLNHRSEAVETLRWAAARITDQEARRRLDGELALLAATDPSADEVAKATLRDARADGAPLAPNAALAVAVELAGAGELDRAVGTVDLTVASELPLLEEEPTNLELLRLTRAWASLLAGAVIEAEADAELAYRQAVRERGYESRARWCFARGLLACARGRARTAVRELREATAMMEAPDMGFGRPARAYLAMAEVLLGDATAADDQLRAVDTENRILDRLFAVDVARAGAWVLGARGELSAAAQAATRAGALAVESGQPALEMWACHDVARFGGAAAVVERLEHLADTVDGPLVGAFAVHARGLAADDGKALDQVSATFAGLGFDLFGAEASTAAAAAHRRAGRKASAFASAEQASRLAEQCEGARTPALGLADQPEALTAREREIADLAAGGLASKEIAGRLGIKTRTVDNLLGRVYTKLGVAGRQELAEVIRRS